MENLPIEILQQIFILLRQEDQMECMLTCRLWKNIMEDSCLFRTLNVYFYSFLREIWKKIQEKPGLAENVHDLTVYIYHSKADPVGDGLPSFFEKLPNLRKLRVYGPSYDKLVALSSLTLSWHKNIESIEEDSGYSMAAQLLSNNVCPNLTHLRFYHYSNNIITLLKNAPALKSLFISGIHINFDDLYSIHESLPNLETLHFERPTIHRDGVGRRAIPANSVTKLSLSYITLGSLDIELGMIQFITVMYPNLVELLYITSYYSRTSEETEILYKDGLNPFLQTLGPQLKKFHTNYMLWFQDSLMKLDNYNCRIEHMEASWLRNEPFPNLAQSQQTSYIRTLVLSDFVFTSFDWLKQFKVLETLEFIIDRYKYPARLYFNDITNNCASTLKSLTLRNLIVGAELVNATQYNLRNLSFIRCELSRNAIWFIDRHFPLLANLKVKNCYNLPKSLILPSAELESFCFIDSKKGGANYALVRSFYDGEERLYYLANHRPYSAIYYYFREFNDSDFSLVKSQLVDDNIKISPNITLCCFKVKNVVMCR